MTTPELEAIGGAAAYVGLAIYSHAPKPGEPWTKQRMYQWAYEVVGTLLNRPSSPTRPAGPAQV